MTDTTAQEPTMEEILASIRRIISEDDAPAAEATAAAPMAEPAAPEAPLAPVDAAPSMHEADETIIEDEEILDLTDRYDAPETETETIGDLDVGAPEPEPFPTTFHPEPEPLSHDPAPSVSSVPYDTLVSDATTATAASAFAGLAASLRQPDPVPAGGTGPTIDDLARALLRPMLKDWLDANLPGIVEAAVKKEVERISRSA